MGKLMWVCNTHTDTPEWIDWVFAHINLDQIREIAGRLFTQNFRANYEAEHGIPFRVVTPEPSIPELEEEPTEEAQGQWEIGSNVEIPGFGNFKSISFLVNFSFRLIRL
jgi:hypothetical protein